MATKDKNYREILLTPLVQVLDLATSAWRPGPALRRPRYGHTCLLTELGGRRGVMVAGGALTGNIVEFLDLDTGEWENLASTNYRIGGYNYIRYD